MRLSTYAELCLPEPIKTIRPADLIWQYINSLITQAKNAAGLDENAHGKISMWIALGDLPAWRVERLAAIDAWSDTAWIMYYTLKAQAVSGKDVELPENLTPCPHSFTELLFEEL